MTTVGTVNGGEVRGTNQAPMQTVVVVQQPVGQANVVGTGGATNRYPRWAYLVFSIGFFVYHFMFGWFWLGLSLATNAADQETDSDLSGYGALFFFCGALPSLIFWIWMICDSTVFCANGDNRSDPVTRICCCNCANGWIMMVPIAIGALLRFILWCAMFGIFADFLNRVDGDVVIDNFFWMFLSLTALDCGPAIYLSLDWFWYYGKMDYDGILGTRDNPIRCIVAQMSVIFIICWAFIAVFEELADDAAPYIWPWIIYGVIATASLVFAAFLWFSGNIKGNVVSNPIFRIVGIILGAAICVMNLIVWGYFLDFGFSTGEGTITLGFVMYAMYLSSISIPAAWAWFQFKVGDTANQNQQPAV